MSKIAILTATIWCNNNIYSPGRYTDECLVKLAEQGELDIIKLESAGKEKHDKVIENAEPVVQPDEEDLNDKEIISAISVNDFSSLSGKEQINYINKLESEISDEEYYEVLNSYLEVSKKNCKEVIEEKLSEYE